MGGIGPVELLIFSIVGLVVVAVPVSMIVLLVLLFRKRNSDSECILKSNAQLREEIQGLRQDLKRNE